MKHIVTILLIVFVTLGGCGGTGEPEKSPGIIEPLPTPTPPPINETAICFQKTNSPSYPDGIGNFTVTKRMDVLNNHELNLVATTYDCLLFNELISEEEHACLMEDIPNLRIVYGLGNTEDRSFNCGEGIAHAGCINDNVFVISSVRGTDDTIIHESCHRAAHLTIGQRGHFQGWFVPGLGDCVCERVLR